MAGRAKNITVHPPYFGAILYRNPDIMAYNILGTQSAIPGGRKSVWTNISLNFRNRIYEKLSAIPMPMFQPIPPRLFFEESDTPIIVRMKAENGRAKRVCFSI